MPACIASRVEGDHLPVSTTLRILVDEVSPIAISWSGLTLYGTPAAAKALLNTPYPTCEPRRWSVGATDLDPLSTG